MLSIRHREALLNVDNLVGARGVATTPLLPGGKARIGNRLFDVISNEDEIPRGSEIVVVEVHGTRIIVGPAGPAAAPIRWTADSPLSSARAG